MPRFRGPVERARKDLREHGLTPREARDGAPQLAAARQAAQDRQERPFSWLGARAIDTPAAESAS